MARRVLVADSPNFVPVLRLEANRLPPDPDVVSMIAYVLFKTNCGYAKPRKERSNSAYERIMTI